MIQELRGQRILITRPRHQAQELADGLKSHGAHPIKLPTVRVTPSEGSPYTEGLNFVRRLHESAYSATLLTSANGVTALHAALAEVQGTVGAVNNTTCFSVGPATTRAAGEIGITDLITSSDFSGAGVLQTARAHFGDTLGDQRFFFPRALLGRDHLVRGLKEAGASVDVARLYQTVPIGEGPELPDTLGWVTFTSPSAVEGFFNVYSLPSPTKIACIGPVTSKELEKHGLKATVVATEHTIGGLINALVDFSRKA